MFPAELIRRAWKFSVLGVAALTRDTLPRVIVYTLTEKKITTNTTKTLIRLWIRAFKNITGILVNFDTFVCMIFILAFSIQFLILVSLTKSHWSKYLFACSNARYFLPFFVLRYHLWGEWFLWLYYLTFKLK